STQVRGGSGIFTGSPAYVMGLEPGGCQRHLDRVRCTCVDADCAGAQSPVQPESGCLQAGLGHRRAGSTYELAVTTPDYRFPQTWRSNLAIDQRLPWGMTGTIEYLYNQDVNGTYYINANLSAPNGRFNGPDTRPRWIGGGTVNRINSNIDNNIVLKNQSIGTSYVASASLEKAFASGFFAKASYAYGSSRNTVDPGSIAFGSWSSNQHPGDPNNPGVGYSSGFLGHRAFVVASYRKQYFGFGATGISVFNELRTLGNTSYVYGGDLNGDGGTANDLIYVPNNISEMNFQQYNATVNGVVRTFTVAEQVTAWNSYINQDPYLRRKRGQIVERGALFLPTVFRADLSITQDIFATSAVSRTRFSCAPTS
ncbi:MAG: TonB-dependent receptor, partial [Aquincola sp.]|nr:TonB-dependent receptor [Aquincola sp.]